MTSDDKCLIEPGQLWVSTAQLARRFGKSEDWVVTHAHLLGGAPVSPGSRNSKLHYHLPTADAHLASTMLSATRAQPPSHRRSRSPKQRSRTRGGAPALSFR